VLQLHLIIVPLVFAALLAATIFFHSKARKKSLESGKEYTDSIHALFGFMGMVFSAIMGIAILISLIPFQPKFWFVHSEAGTITEIDSRSASDGSNLITDFAIKLDSVEDVLISNDPRFLQVEKGDSVDLICTWEWVPYGKDIYNCQLGG